MKKSLLSIVLCVALLLGNICAVLPASANENIVELKNLDYVVEGAENVTVNEDGSWTITGKVAMAVNAEYDLDTVKFICQQLDAKTPVKITLYDGYADKWIGLYDNWVGPQYFPVGTYDSNDNVEGIYNWNKFALKEGRVATLTSIYFEFQNASDNEVTLYELYLNDGNKKPEPLADISIDSANYEENAEWEASSLLADASEWTSFAGGGGNAIVTVTETGIAVSANGGWPAAALDNLDLTVDWATAAFRVDYSVLIAGRVQLFYGASNINNYDSKEYVDLSNSNGNDMAPGHYFGTMMVKDLIPESAVSEDGTVTFNSLKVYAIGTGTCINVDVLDVLTVAAEEPEVGTYENPYQLSFGMFGRAIVYLEPGAEAYVQAADANGTIVSAYGANEDLEDAVDGWFVQYGRQTVYPEGANASFEMNPFSDIFSVMNTSETEGRTIYFSLEEAPKGNIGTFESGSDVAVENVDGAYVVVGGDYITVTDGMEVANRFVATEDGTLTFSIFAENWFYVINNITTGVYGDGQWSDSDPVMDTYEIEVAAGDEIQIIINTYDAMNPWAAPEGSIEWSLTFEAAGADYVCAHDGLVHMDATEAGCHMNGCIEHWVCYDCETVWQDEALTQITNIKNVVIPATGEGNLVHFDAVEAGCHMNGNVEYWVCYDCEQVWTDEALTQLSNIKNVIVPAVGGDVIYVEAKDATCYENGNVEHWYCETCEQVWADEALTQLTNHKNVVIGATHTNLVHMDAVEAGCHMNGNVEYWVCYDCGGVWTDEALNEVSNIKNVIIPALGGDVIHVEAKDPTATENGNIEHWYCETCEQVWQDEALTQLTNHKNVIIPATGEEEPELNELARLFYYVNGLVELTEEELVGMDVNNDGVINLFDAARVFYYVNGVIDEL